LSLLQCTGIDATKRRSGSLRRLVFGITVVELGCKEVVVVGEVVLVRSGGAGLAVPHPSEGEGKEDGAL